MTVFADSSALVKLYVDEPGHVDVRAIAVFAVSLVARAEVPAALWRKARTASLTATQARALVAEFEADWYGEAGQPPRLVPLGLELPLLEQAGRLAGVHGLRAYDAVQLATALTARAAAPEVDVVACFDSDLRSAAAAEGFRLLPA